MAQDDLERISRLGLEFVKRGMQQHAECLRAYFRSVRDRQPPPVRPIAFDPHVVTDWMGAFRLPPFEALYPLHPSVECAGCQTLGRPARALVWPGGALWKCSRCWNGWVQNDDTHARLPRGAGRPPPFFH